VPSGGAIRKPGGGRKRTAEQDETLVRDLESLIELLSRGDPESALDLQERAQTGPGIGPGWSPGQPLGQSTNHDESAWRRE
jgi:hypothetical protein